MDWYLLLAPLLLLPIVGWLAASGCMISQRVRPADAGAAGARRTGG